MPCRVLPGHARSELDLFDDAHHCRASADARAELSRMMAERFTTFVFTEPLPMSARKADWAKCGRCAAAFYLRGPSCSAAASSSAARVAPASAPQPASGCDLPANLTALATLREAGHLTADEFAAAKAQLLGLARPES